MISKRIEGWFVEGWVNLPGCTVIVYGHSSSAHDVGKIEVESQVVKFTTKIAHSWLYQAIREVTSMNARIEGHIVI